MEVSDDREDYYGNAVIEGRRAAKERRAAVWQALKRRLDFKTVQAALSFPNASCVFRFGLLFILGIMTKPDTSSDTARVLRCFTQHAPRLQGEIVEQFLKSIKTRCPEGLTPVIYRRNHERWAPGYLIERLEKGGYRLLSLDPELRLHRLRSGAEVIEIAQNTHAVLVAQYKDFQAGCLEAKKHAGKRSKKE